MKKADAAVKVIPMKASQAMEALMVSFKTKRPLFIWGPPGIWKSSVTAQTSKKWLQAEKLDDTNWLDLRAVLMDPVDLRGIPDINSDSKAQWCPPAFLPTQGKGVLFIDELPAAPPLVQNAFLQLALDRKLGEYKLPDGWRVVAAGNDITHRTYSHRMPKALANRFIHVEGIADADEWNTWALRNKVHPAVISFIKNRPNLLMTFNPDSDEKAFASPRTWEFASDIIKADPSADIRLPLLQGTVGCGPAMEFVAWLNTYQKLPDYEVVLQNPKTAPIPDEPSIMYALCVTLAYVADGGNFDRICSYMNRMDGEWRVKIMKDIVRKDPMLKNTREYSEWASVNYELL